MEMPSKHPWLFKRQNTYYLRAKVPADLVGIYPAAEIKRSLKTQDRTEAARLIHREAALAEQIFADYRLHGGPPPPQIVRRRAEGKYVPRYSGVGQPPANLTSSEELGQAEIEQFLLAKQLDWQRWVDRPILDLPRKDRAEQADLLDQDASEDAPNDDDCWNALFSLTSEVLEPAGYYFDRNGAAALSLGEKLLRQEKEAFGRRAARLRGGIIEHYVPPITAAPSSLQERPNRSKGKTLEEVIAIYDGDLSRSQIVQKTRNEDQRTFSLLKEQLGGRTPINDIRRAQCNAFRDLICSLPKNAQQVCPGMTAKQASVHALKNNLPKLSPKGANKYLHKLSALMKYAIDEEFYDGPNPAKKIAIPQKHSIDDRDPFSSLQLTTIFQSNAFQSAAKRAHDVGHGVDFWVPLLAIFMGLRLGEACQLLATDFETDNSVHFIRIQATEGRRLKTLKATRVIPCHPHLIALGLLDFVEKARFRNDGGRRLFPEELRGKDGYFSPYSKRYGRFLGEAGAKVPKTSFHSFRHNFRDALRKADVREDLAFSLGGWKQGWASTGNLYGSRPAIDMLSEQVAKVEFLELPLALFRSLMSSRRL